MAYMTLVAYAICGLEPEERTGDGMNPIRKTKGKTRQMLMPSEFKCTNSQSVNN